MNPIFKLKNLVFRSAIYYPNILIEPNTIVFIQGQSGCGKSTLLKLLNATLPFNQGEILFKGTNINSIDTIKLRRKVILAAQSVYLFPNTIKENFLLFHQYNETPIPDDSKIDKFLNICCIHFNQSCHCTSLSGGERQRIYLSIALSLASEVLMLDEPTSALDSDLSNQVMKNITDYCSQNQITLLVVSHDSILRNKYAQQHILLGGDFL